MTLPSHVLSVDLLKLILRSKDPLPPKFFCHSCRKKFTIKMTATSPRPRNCELCNSEFIEWLLPEDPHQRAARLRESAARPRKPPSPSPPPSPPASPKQEESMETDPPPPPPPSSSSEKEVPSQGMSTAASGGPPGVEAMEQEKSEDTPQPSEEEEEEEEEEKLESSEEEEPPARSQLSSQPMLMVSAGGDPDGPTLTLNLFPCLDDAGPRKDGRKGPLRTIIVQQNMKRNFIHLAQEYLAQIVDGGQVAGGPPRRQQLLVGLTGGAQTANSDPADFVWGARGLDSMMSRLLGSMSDRGPPPAKKENVDAIPVVAATQDVVDEYVDGCTVCKDVFTVGETLRKLPCQHLFHEKCIVTWLKLHDTCPSCRFHINTAKDKAEEMSAT